MTGFLARQQANQSFFMSQVLIEITCRCFGYFLGVRRANSRADNPLKLRLHRETPRSKAATINTTFGRQ
jgi:hypothetical protein